MIFSAIFFLASATSKRHVRRRLGETFEPAVLRLDFGEFVADLVSGEFVLRLDLGEFVADL